MAGPVLARTDRALRDDFKAMVRARINTVPLDLLTAGDMTRAMAWVLKGYETWTFPDYPDAVIVRCRYGWGYLPTLASSKNLTGYTPGHKLAILEQTTNKSFVFATLGEFVVAIAAANATNLHSGVLRVMAEYLSPERFETEVFLHALGGTLVCPPGLFEVGGA